MGWHCSGLWAASLIPLLQDQPLRPPGPEACLLPAPLELERGWGMWLPEALSTLLPWGRGHNRENPLPARGRVEEEVLGLQPRGPPGALPTLPLPFLGVLRCMQLEQCTPPKKITSPSASSGLQSLGGSEPPRLSDVFPCTMSGSGSREPQPSTDTWDRVGSKWLSAGILEVQGTESQGARAEGCLAFAQ